MFLAGLPLFISFSTSPELGSAGRCPMHRIGDGGRNITGSPKLPGA
jgi:hypothetical protein